ncbi:MAG: hypothetical protein SGJ20_12095 [Planctomycetota bacterium]|nr:hypothetical protein [Planctomycetota bacterium]
MPVRFSSPMMFAGLLLLALVLPSQIMAAEKLPIVKDGKPVAQLVLPKLTGDMATLPQRTINDYTKPNFDWELAAAKDISKTGTYIVIGDVKNNATLAELAKSGVNLSTDGLGEEGFRIVTHTAGDRRYVILLANTPVALKYACQELVFFRLGVTDNNAAFDWPLAVKKVPDFAYRGIYMLPCWAQHDSVESWRRVLLFNSELTINRNWFWLNGFPLNPQYNEEYKGTDLSNVPNVRSLIELTHAEGMKFFVGGGWYTWHHEKVAKGDLEKGVDYYRNLLKVLPGVDGIYLEPPGEIGEVEPAKWSVRTKALKQLATEIWKTQPGFEFAIAVGKINDPGYLKALHEIDTKRIYWWWCWGDPVVDKALEKHPLVLRWHTMPNYDMGAPPKKTEKGLTGFATSYDPGMGFGNLWNGKGLGVETGIAAAREFHPHTIPYFGLEYQYREHAWDVEITDAEFAARLARRLFDEPYAAEGVKHYLALTETSATPEKGTEEFLKPIEAFLNQHGGNGSARNRDTFSRMRTAIAGFRQLAAEPKKTK